jgi:predicted transcriptional regulator of viral defense system
MGMRRRNIHYKIIEKAKRLVKNGQVEMLDNGRYNVIGDHGTYNVVETVLVSGTREAAVIVLL